MKLHLPKMLTAALIAAITAVGSSAFADDAELTTYTTTNYNASTVSNFNAVGFIITLNGPRLTTTPTDVPITTCDLVYLDSITLASLRAVPGGSSVTLALADANGKVLSLSNNVVSSTGQAKWDFSNTTVATDSPLYFYWLDTARGIAKGDILTSGDMATWNNHGCGGNGVSNYNNTQNLTSCGFLEALSVVQNTQYAPKLTIVTSGPVPQNVYTWKATGTPAYWDEEATNWILAGADSSYTSDPTNIVDFNAGEFAMDVTVSGSIEAAKVNVDDNYQFTVASGSSLTVDTLSVAADKEVTVAGEGSIALAKVVLANGATINMGAAASLAVTVADDADNTAIKATKDITLTSLAGPADGKELTISAEGHTVAVQGNNSFMGNLVVDKGTVKLDASAHSLGAYNGNNVKDHPADAPDKTITVNEGGTIDLNGKADQTYIYTLAGGSLVNNGGNTSAGSMQTIGIELEANSTIGGTGDFYLLGPGYDKTFVELNNYKLTKTGANKVGFRNTNVTSGTIEVQQGNIEFIDGNNSSLAADIILNGGTISGTVNVADDIEITAQKTASINPTLNNANNKTVTLRTAEGQTLTLSNGITLATGKLNVDGIVTVSGKSLDLSSGGNAAGTVSVLENSVLNVNNGMWMHSNSRIELAQGGTVNIAGLSIVGNTGSTITATAANQQYSTTNDQFTIANAAITATADVTIGNVLTNVGVYTGAHAVTLNATADSVTVAEHGTINFGTSGATGAITVEDGGIIGTYAKTDTGATTITSEGTAVLNNAVALNAGSLTMSGAFNVDALAFQGEQTIAGGEHENNGFATESGSLTVVTKAAETTLTADGATVVRGGHTFVLANDGTAALNSTNYSAFYITNQSETVTKAKSQEEAQGVTLASIHVSNGATLDVNQNIDLSLVTAETGAKLNILSGHTVSVGDATTVATIAGEGTYALKSGSKTMTGTLATGEDWKGTVVVSNVGSFADINLNTYGHDGSKVEFDGVTGHFGPHIITYAPELVLGEGGLTLNNGYSTDGQGGPDMVYTFAGGVSGTGDMVFNKTTQNTVRQQLVFSGDVEDWSGTLSVVARFNVTAHYIGVDKTVNSTISRTGGDLHVKVGTGEDASVVTFTQGITASDLSVLAGATAEFQGNVDAGAITVGDGAFATFNDLHITQAITSTGTVTLNNDALEVNGFQVQGGAEGYFDVNGEFTTGGNGYEGKQESYLTIVDGGTVIGEMTVTQEGETYSLSDSGNATKGDGWVHYDTYYLTSGELLTSALENETTTVVMSGGVLTADTTLENVAATGGKIVIEQGVTIASITADNTEIQGKVAPENVTIAQESYVVFDDGIEEDNGLRFSKATVLNYGEDAPYSSDNSYMMVAADQLTLVSVAEQPEIVEVANTLQVSSITNNSSSLLVIDSLYVNELASVEATGGSIGLVAGLMPVANMTIAEGKSVMLLDPFSQEQEILEGTVTITESLTAGGGTLLANLNLVDGSTLDLQTGEGAMAALTLGSNLAFVDGAIVNLDATTLAKLDNLVMGSPDNYLELIHAAQGTTLTYGEGGLDNYDDMWFGQLFDRTAGEYTLKGDFKVVATGETFGLTKVSNVPEPTTGTLSLLALATLAARRRRH